MEISAKINKNAADANKLKHDLLTAEMTAEILPVQYLFNLYDWQICISLCLLVYFETVFLIQMDGKFICNSNT